MTEVVIDIHGTAILDYYKGQDGHDLILHDPFGEAEEMPVEVFFREPEDFSALEQLAMTHCRGSILDLGAGAGAHSLFLQHLGAPVTGLDNSPGCAEVMRLSGLKEVAEEDYRIHRQQYDTLLLLMNGLGLACKLDHVKTFLQQCGKLLVSGGQIIVDSSDINYLYENYPKPDHGYYGDFRYQYEYKGEKGDWFDWVYVDQSSLEGIVSALGLDFEILLTDEHDQYLARISGF
ncbi:MAG: class I SAM-dependent methyltransferase [Cyclobacteriaceae bacterium]